MPKCKTSRKERKVLRQKRRRERKAEQDCRDKYTNATLAEDGTMDQLSAEMIIALSEEERFKQKHAAEFEDNISTPLVRQPEIKPEPAEDSGILPQSSTVPASTRGAAIAIAEQRRLAHGTGTSQSVLCPVDTTPNDRQKVLDTILSHDFGDEMTRSAINQILQYAQDSADRDDEFGVAYIEAQIDRLHLNGTSPPRLTEVISSFQTALGDLAKQLCSRIDALAHRTIATAHSTNATVQGRVDLNKRKYSYFISSDQGVQQAATRPEAKHAGSAKVNKPQLEALEVSDCHSESSKSSSEGTKGKKVKRNGSRYMSNDEECYVVDKIVSDNDKDNTLTEGEKMNTSSRKSNLRLYGCRRPKCGFDVYARCVISAFMAPPGDDGTAMEIRAHAHRIWRSVPRVDKVEWDRLFDDRHSSNNIFKKGQVLLETQGLLSRLKPDFHPAATPSAAKTVCRPVVVPHATSSRPIVQQGEDKSKSDLPAATPLTAKTTRPAIEVSHLAISSRPIFQNGEDKSREIITRFFPYLTQATSLTPVDQACYVPFASRGEDKNRACLFVINTPDTNTGTLTTDSDVRTACQQSHLSGLIDVISCNNNIVSAKFATFGDALTARNWVSIALPSTTSNGAVTSKAEFHMSRAPRIFSCDAYSLEIEHDTVAHCVSQALRGRKALDTRAKASSTYKLLRQETHDPNDARMKYFLRFDDNFRAPGVQRFYIPLDAESGGGKVWGIFRPADRGAGCILCGASCQLGRNSTCHFTTVIATQDGPV